MLNFFQHCCYQTHPQHWGQGCVVICKVFYALLVLIVLPNLIMVCIWKSVCACSFVWLWKGAEFSPGFSTPIRMFTVITQEQFTNIFRLKIELSSRLLSWESCLQFFKKNLFYWWPSSDGFYRQWWNHLSNKNIIFLKWSLKTETGGGD